MRAGARAFLLAALGVSGAAAGPLRAQTATDGGALWRQARAMAARGQLDSAQRTLERAATVAGAAGDRATEQATQRGRADLWQLRGCADSAVRILRDAVAAAAPGDRASADALVRLLASRGTVAEARTVLVQRYRDVPSVGRTITGESVRFLQGMAAVELAGGQESAALSTLNSALAIAVRLHEGDVTERSEHAAGEITAENAWLLFDLAQLRRTAKSTGIRSPREHARLMGLLTDAWPALEALPDDGPPVTRLADRLVMAAALCTAARGPCPAPVVTKGCP